MVVLPPAEGAWQNISCFTGGRTVSIPSLLIPQDQEIAVPEISAILFSHWEYQHQGKIVSSENSWVLISWTDGRIPMLETVHVGGCGCDLRGFPIGEDKKYYSIAYCKRK